MDNGDNIPGKHLPDMQYAWTYNSRLLEAK